MKKLNNLLLNELDKYEIDALNRIPNTEGWTKIVDAHSSILISKLLELRPSMCEIKWEEVYSVRGRTDVLSVKLTKVGKMMKSQIV
jgi:hypothetical protein